MLSNMKVLWFTNTPSCYMQSHNYNGGGWISSLEKMIKTKYPEINLGVAFYNNVDSIRWQKVECDDVVYYPMGKPHKTLRFRLEQLVASRHKASLAHEKHSIPQFLEIVRDFKPDIIHVFGSENTFGLLAKYINVPIVLHIQGVLSAYINSFLPPAISWNDFLFSSICIKSILWHMREKLSFERNSITEVRMFENIKYFMGRTHWDKSIVSLINPSAQYFTCGEVLRDTFYGPINRCEGSRPVFISVLSWQIYKGYDLVLKTANLLKKLNIGDFEWHIYGNVNPRFMEKKFRLSSENTSIVFKGVASADELKNALLTATALIHPSYIENSSNVICEAQITGCPCIAAYAGGNSTIIEDRVTGLLVPPNDPYMLAYSMKSLLDNDNLRLTLSQNAHRVASSRHDKDKIAARAIEIYKYIYEQAKYLK